MEFINDDEWEFLDEGENEEEEDEIIMTVDRLILIDEELAGESDLDAAVKTRIHLIKRERESYETEEESYWNYSHCQKWYKRSNVYKVEGD